MKTSIKCEACGANLEIDSEKHLKFCPYCGAAVQIPKTAFEHEKEMAEFNEKVRQNQVQEKIKQEKSSNLMLLGFVIGLVILVIVMIKFL